MRHATGRAWARERRSLQTKKQSNLTGLREFEGKIIGYGGQIRQTGNGSKKKGLIEPIPGEGTVAKKKKGKELETPQLLIFVGPDWRGGERIGRKAER